MALNIKNLQVERLATEVARIPRETKTDAIRRALKHRKNRLLFESRKKGVVKPAKPRDRVGDIIDYLEREVWPKIPADVLGKKMTRRERDEILGMHI